MTRMVRVISEYGQMQMYGCPVRPHRVHGGEAHPDIGHMERLLTHSAYASERVARAILSGFVLLAEGEAADVYMPHFYTLWAATASESVHIPHYLDEMDVFIYSLSGKYAMLEIVMILRYFRIPFHLVIDHASDERNDMYVRLNAWIAEQENSTRSDEHRRAQSLPAAPDEMMRNIQHRYAAIRHDPQQAYEWVTIYRPLFQNRKYAIQQMVTDLDKNGDLPVEKREQIMRIKPSWNNMFTIEDVALNMISLSSNPSAKFDSTPFLPYWLASMALIEEADRQMLLFIGKYAYSFSMLEELRRQTGPGGSWSRIDLAHEVVRGLVHRNHSTQPVNDRVIAKCGLGNVFELIRRVHLERRIKSRHAFTP